MKNDPVASPAAGGRSLLTVIETADLLKVSRKTIYYWVSRHEIPFLKVGKHLRFNPIEVVEFFANKTTLTRPPCLPDPRLLQNQLVRSALSTRESTSRSVAIRNRTLAETEKE